jgi:hypothetical protein
VVERVLDPQHQHVIKDLSPCRERRKRRRGGEEGVVGGKKGIERRGEGESESESMRSKRGRGGKKIDIVKNEGI